jgi:hypothetical protein
VTLLILFERLAGTSPAEAAAWVRLQASELLAAPGVEAIRISRLRPPSAAVPSYWEWMVVITLAPGGDAAFVVDRSACRDFLAELRSLQLHPMTVLLEPGTDEVFSRAQT